MKMQWLGSTLFLIIALSLAACGGGSDSVPFSQGQTPGVISVSGNVIGSTAPAGPAGALLRIAQVPLTADTAVVMVDESRSQAADQVVNAANGRFSLSVPAGHDYVLVLREGSPAGRTLGVLVDAAGRTTFSLANGSRDVDLGDIELDLTNGKAWMLGEVSLARPAEDLTDSDGDGVPDVCDRSDDEDEDGVADHQDHFPFDAGESWDTSGNGIGDNADDDDDNDGVPDDQDAFPRDPAEQADTDKDGMGDNLDPDDDNDGIADGQDAFPTNPAEWQDTDSDGMGDNLDLDDDGDGVADASDAFPKNTAEWADTDKDGIGDTIDPDDDNDGIPDAQDPFPLLAGDFKPVVPPPDLNPLNQIAVPEPPQLSQFVKNKIAAIQLGKALFWDMQVGSDGIVACGTCHFSAGADPRKKNQINPGTNAFDTVFGNNRLGEIDFPQFGPNYTLQPSDFPLHERKDPADSPFSPIVRDTNDIVGSQGVRLSHFVDVVAGSAVESVSPLPDPVFNADGVNTRRVEPRHTPSVINAAFNFSNFSDGRANFLFNGENAFGPADPEAGVWFNDAAQGLVKRPVLIQFASLASQAVTPPLSDFEMSARGRTFPKIGEKMLTLTPLGKQLVHPADSVLGTLSRATLRADGTVSNVKGLNSSYSQLIQEAFRNNLWDATQLTPDGFTQMEANFALFFGLAVQLYEATLISDQTPFDNWLAGDDTALTDQQKFGFSLFNGIANCTACHVGVELTTASAENIAFTNNFENGIIELMFTSDATQAIYDEGFNNTGQTPTTDDLGRGGTAPFINPLTGQLYPLSHSGLAVLDAQGLLPFETPILDLFLPVNIPVNADGLFKVPGLRNVALTAPYFHNGSAATLEDVIDFYVRGGNFPAENLADLDPIIGEGLRLLEGKENLHDAIVAFLESLTDPRVVAASAPFDHPELFVPEGDPEVLIRIPATDADGRVAP
jgi:cytochrome c peroxidase